MQKKIHKYTNYDINYRFMTSQFKSKKFEILVIFWQIVGYKGQENLCFATIHPNNGVWSPTHSIKWSKDHGKKFQTPKLDGSLSPVSLKIGKISAWISYLRHLKIAEN